MRLAGAPGREPKRGVGDAVWTEDITGKILDDDSDGTSDHVTFNTIPTAGATFSVTNAPMDKHDDRDRRV